MLCGTCGRELLPGAAFCQYCGAKVVPGGPGGPGADEPVYQVSVKRVLKTGKLLVYRDRTEFVTSGVQKAIFSYENLVAVKKEWDHIDFISEDGHKESCPADRKCVHEAFLYIEQMSRPYLAQRDERLLSEGIRYSFPSNQGMLNEGVLNISAEQAEFKGKAGKNEIVFFRDVKSVSAPGGTLDFVLFDRRVRSFAISRELRGEVLAFVNDSVAVYLAQRKEALLAQGIYFSFFGPDGRTVNFMADRVERRDQQGQVETIPFRDVRTASVHAGTIDIALTDGTSRPFSIDEGSGSEVLTFVMEAIEPYVKERSAGFDAAFGIDERIEINQQRGVFHIIRQGGKEITGEWPLELLTKCRWEERRELNALGSVVSGSMALFKSAARAAGRQGSAEAEDWISCAGVALTLTTAQGDQMENIWFGIFPAGMSLTNKKYERYLLEWAAFSNYLKTYCPECKQIGSVPAGLEVQPPVRGGGNDAPEGPRPEAPGPAAGDPAAAAQLDDLGIARYIEGISRFISSCPTPMPIAFQGNRGSEENSVLRMLFNRLGNQYGTRLWLNARQFSQGESGEALSVLVGKKLVGLFGENENPAGKGEDIITNLAGLFTGTVAGDSSIGKDMVGGLFNRRSADSSEQLVELLAQKAGALSPNGAGKAIIFIDGLDWVVPARVVELLETMRPFFTCKGCVFVVAIEYSAVLSGIRERYGQGFDENRGKGFFDEMFKMSFRVPASSYNVENYVKSKLEQLGGQAGDEDELDICVSLIQNSVGSDLKSIDRLFTSFHLLKNMVSEEIYQDRYKRLVMFALLCMQTTFRNIYECVVQRRDSVTPEFLSGLCGHSAQPWDAGQVSDDEKAAYQDFGSAFSRIVDLNGDHEISEAECRAFVEVLEYSSITYK